MTVEIRCDFCDKIIETRGGENQTKDSVEVKEYICEECKAVDLQQTWADSQGNLEDEWVKVEKEKRNFFENLLKNQKKKLTIEKKKKHFGSFYKGA